MKKILILMASHLSVLALGFALGIYFLPILIEPPAQNMAQVKSHAKDAQFKARFKRDLKGSDFFHWGEGDVTLGTRYITFIGKLAPGPDYKLYLAPSFVETEADFLKIKAKSLYVADVKSFKQFSIRLAKPIDYSQYTTVVIWCETFKEFISAAKFR